jgi:D-sedoheptulose 7-phosphate isomerase
VTFSDAVALHTDAAIQCAQRFQDGRLKRALDILARPGVILICGNGGSAADAAHMTAELVGRFRKERQPIPALNLAADAVFMTAWSNDRHFDDVFSRQVCALRKAASCVVCISTSGESMSVVKAATAACRYSIPTIGLTGDGGGRLSRLVDLLLDVPSTKTEIIQQLHQMVYHHLCGELEALLTA